MANRKTGIDIICPRCGKEFYIIRSRISKCKNHCCSIKCSSVFTAKQRSIKLRQKEYPIIYKNPCLYCGGNIIIENVHFDKPNRKFCSYSCKIVWRNKNIPQSLAQKKATAERSRKLFTRMNKTQEHRIAMSLANIGNKSHFWKGGYVSLARRLRNSYKSVEWRNRVFQRDNYTCHNCGVRNGNGKTVYLEADHIIPFSKLFSEFIKLQNVKDEDILYKNALKFSSLWDIKNGKTLCKTCHRATTTFSYKANFYPTNKKGKGIYLNPKKTES